MPLRLSDHERDILRKLANGEAVSVSSHQRLRLELAGLIRDGARGIVLTIEGRGLARQAPTANADRGPAPQAKVARDGRGRRLPFQRRSVF
jgi:hypothetical protein